MTSDLSCYYYWEGQEERKREKIINGITKKGTKEGRKKDRREIMSNNTVDQTNTASVT